MRLCSCLVMRLLVSRGQAIVFTDEWSSLRRPKLARVPEPIAGLTLWRTRIEIVRSEHDPGSFRRFSFHTAKQIYARGSLKKTNEAGGRDSHDADSRVEHRSVRCCDGLRRWRRGATLPRGRTSLSVRSRRRH